MGKGLAYCHKDSRFFASKGLDMAQSRRFKTLWRRLLEIEKLLPATKPLGNYTQLEQDGVRAYRVLCHAEFEAFFEDWSLRILNRAHANYLRTSRSNKVIRCLVHSCSPRWTFSNGDRITHAVADFKETVKKNHGLKEGNLCKLFLPLGIVESSFDQAWILLLNDLGLRRGTTAHTSGAVANTIDPVTELTTIRQVLAGAQTFDEHLAGLV
jgi:hypothetical protein